MFLKSVELFGFKSFADRWKFDFSEGITALLGPNGSGKSNVVDSVKWVLGTSAPSSFRASKNEDVIFNGTETRPPMQFCEVILTVNNEERLLNIEATEVEIKRRLHRGSGLSEYFINQNLCRLTDIKNLFLDTGVGKTAYSILEQGKIDQILSAKAEDRRYIFEEAAGISKSKVDKDIANRNLQKNEEDLKQIQIQYDSSKVKYDRLKVQVDQVRKRKELQKMEEDLDAELQLSYVQNLRKTISLGQEQTEKLQKEISELNAQLENIEESINEKTIHLDNLRRNQDKCGEAIHRNEEKKNAAEDKLNLISNNLELQQSRIVTSESNVKRFEDRLNALKEMITSYEARLSAKRELLSKCEKREIQLTTDINNIQENINSFENNINQLNVQNDDLVNQRSVLNNKIYDLAKDITLKLSSSIKGSAYSTELRRSAESNFILNLNKVINILKTRIQIIKDLINTSSSNEKIISELNSAYTDLTEELGNLKGLFQEYNGTIPTFLDEFMDPESTLSEKNILDDELDKIAKQEEENNKIIGDYKKEIIKLENARLLSTSEIDEIKEEKNSLNTEIEVLKNNIEKTQEDIYQFDSDFDSLKQTYQKELDSAEEYKRGIAQTKKEIEKLSERINEDTVNYEALKDQISALLNEINSENMENTDKFNRKQSLNEQLIRTSSNIENLNKQIETYFTEYSDRTHKSLLIRDDHEVTESSEELKKQLESVRNKIHNMGNVNYLAEEEFEEAERTYNLYSSHLEDINKSVDDLKNIVERINTESTERFLNTYNLISDAFMEMFTTLFGGGKAELALTDPENALESGIEILAQPPGQKLSHLSLLSGGQRSMTAVALLFATYKVKSSPFCILDEIDAALDARNVDAFLRVLETFGDKSQFIIITHNKKTAMGASSILGVTQEEPGVSMGMSYSLSDEKDESGNEATLK